MFVDFNILNQLGSPSINSNTFANRPAAGQTGRLFVSTDTFEIYRDNGTTWDLIGGPGSSTITGTGTATQVAYFTSSQAIGSSANLFWDNTNTRLGIGTATPGAALDIHSTGIMAHFNTTSATGNTYIAFQRTGTNVWRLGDQYNAGVNFFQIHNIALSNNAIEIATATNKSIFTALQTYTTGLARGNYFDYNLSVSAGGSFSSPNAITALGASLDLTLAGNATIPSGARSGLDAYNSIAFTGAGTLTHGQGTQIRAYSNLTAGWAFNGSATGTITHLAGLRALFPDNTGSAVTVTNNYALLLNDQTANTGTVTYTNRWGIYQEGASDLNYFAANTLIGTLTNTGDKLNVGGNVRVGGSGNPSLTISGTDGAYTGLFYINAAGGGSSKIYANGGSNTLILGTNSTDRATLDASGNLGLGTSTIYGKFNINSNGAPASTGTMSTGLTISNGTAGTAINIGTNDGGGYNYIQSSYVNSANVGLPLTFFTGATEKMRLDASGNLGLGVSPSAWGSPFSNVLQLKYSAITGSGAGDMRFFTNAYYDGSNYLYIASAYAQRYDQSAGGHVWYTAPSGTAGNAITFTQAMTLNGAGNLLLGTATSTFAAERLQVSGDINTFNSVGGGVVTAVSGKQATLNAGGVGLYMRDYTFSGSDYHEVQFYSNTLGDQVIFKATLKDDGTDTIIYLGDYIGTGTGTVIIIDDINSSVNFNSGVGKYQFGSVPQFANNAAAIAAGYPAGYIYRLTGTGDLKIVI